MPDSLRDVWTYTVDTVEETSHNFVRSTFDEAHEVSDLVLPESSAREVATLVLGEAVSGDEQIAELGVRERQVVDDQENVHLEGLPQTRQLVLLTRVSPSPHWNGKIQELHIFYNVLTRMGQCQMVASDQAITVFC